MERAGACYLVDDAETLQLKFLKGTLGLHFMGGLTPSPNGFYGWWQSSGMPSA
jgi:hypothetical protein